MLVTATQFRTPARGANGEALPIGDAIGGHQELTEDGNITAMAGGTVMVRIATDTAIKITPSGSSAAMLLPANSVEYFAAVPMQTFAVAAVA